MKIKILILFFFVSQASFIFSQEEIKPVKHLITIRDAYYSGALALQGYSGGSLSDFNALAPNSALLKNDLSHYTDNGGGFNIQSAGVNSISIGLNFRDKLKNYYCPSPQLRLSLTHFSGVDLTGGLRLRDKFPIDTLTSSQTGQTLYIDSVISHRYQFEHGLQQIRLDASLIFRTIRTMRFTFYGGIGFTFGITTSSYTDIVYSESRYTETDDISGTAISSTPRNERMNASVSESFSGKNGICYSFYIPAGIDFRVGKRNKFLKKIHLYSESRAGYNYVSIPELRIFKSPGLMIGFGLRVAFD